MNWRKKSSSGPTTKEDDEQLRARRLVEQADAARSAKRRSVRLTVVFAFLSLFVFVPLFLLCCLVNFLTFRSEHASRTALPPIGKLVQVVVPASDAFVIIGSLLALVAALAIAQQAASVPAPGDVRGLAQAYAWQSSASAIGIVAGFLAVQVGLLQWFSGHVAHDWLSNLFAMSLAGLTLAMAATLREWSDQSLVRAMRRAELSDAITTFRDAAARLPKPRYQGNRPARLYVTPLVGLSLMGAILFELGNAAGGVNISRFRSADCYWLVLVIGMSFVFIGVGCVIAAQVRMARTTRTWFDGWFFAFLAVMWSIGGDGLALALAGRAIQRHDGQLGATAGVIFYVTTIPFVAYLISARSARWPANVIQAFVCRSLKRGEGEQRNYLRQLDAEF